MHSILRRGKKIYRSVEKDTGKGKTVWWLLKKCNIGFLQFLSQGIAPRIQNVYSKKSRTSLLTAALFTRVETSQLPTNRGINK